MAEQQIFYNTVTLTAAATALSLYDLVTDTALSYALSKNFAGPVVAMNFISDKAIKVGFSAGQLDDTHGGSLAASTYFTDWATGVGGNNIPLGQIFVYSPTASGTATLIVYIRIAG